MSDAVHTGLGRARTRWLITLFAIAGLFEFAPSSSPLKWIGAIGANGFALLLCAYSCWLLLRKLQCSLLELCVIIGALGNIEGLLLTTPGFFSYGPTMWGLAPLSAAWIFAGAVKAAAQARILGEVDPLPRVGLLLVNWLTLASPAMVIAGLLLHYGRAFNDSFVSTSMAAWSPPLIALGAVGTIVFLALEIKVNRAARRVPGM